MRLDLSALQSCCDGVDLVHRQVWLHGPIDAASVGTAMQAALVLAQTSYDPIEILIVSEGGDVEEAFGLSDLLRSLPVQVHATAYGKCMSAAPMLLVSADPGCRVAGENTQFMIHAVEVASPYATHQDLSGLADCTKNLQSRYCQFLADRTSMPKAHWSRLMRAGKDVFFDAEQALAWGMIDEIVPQKS